MTMTNVFTHRGALRDLQRAVRNHAYEMSPNGIVVPAMRSEITMGGVFDVDHFIARQRPEPGLRSDLRRAVKRLGERFGIRRPFNPADPNYERGAPTTGYNIVPLEARNKLLNQFLKNGSAISAQYVALFEGNVTPDDTITGANFADTTTEFTGYDESTRVAYQAGTVSAAAVDNISNRAAFTISAGVSAKTLYGGGLMQHSGKGNATSGQLCFAASLFADEKIVSAGDVLLVAYAFSLTIPS